jgi:eukaryotic-like serine/threonine-protein kinase
MNSYAIILDNMPQIGDQFDRYQIQAHMAQGGMSDVYRAFDLVDRKEVVIKVPDQSMLGDPAQFERFQRELEVMNTLNHPAILKGLGSGKHNRVPYLVTEFIDGQSLRALLEKSAPLPPEQATNLIRKIAEGMAYCHKNNVIHRDLKPENILISQDGQPIIMDFGLALTKSAHRVTYSNLSATMGTPDYMAPEQIDGQRGDQRTDIYALGIMFYEMLSGQPPFTGDSNMAVMSQHIKSTPQRLDKLKSAITPQLAAIVAQCLLKEPAERFQNMEALVEALNNPENMDISVLDRPSLNQNSTPSLAQMQALRAIGIALVVLLALVALALILQTFRP